MNIKIFKMKICTSQGEVAPTETKLLETKRIANNTVMTTERKLFCYVSDHYLPACILFKRICPWLKQGTPWP